MKLNYFIREFDFLRVYLSPFKRPKIEFYCGKIALGTPYFFPRKWVKGTPKLAVKAAVKKIRETRRWNKNNPDYPRVVTPFRELYQRLLTHSYAVPKKIGFDFVPLGWKTKFNDYRHEWNPMISFVFFKWQVAISFIPEHDIQYWESWLYYTRDTDKNTPIEERIAQCRKKAPCTWSSYKGDEKVTTDYYNLILKEKYAKIK